MGTSSGLSLRFYVITSLELPIWATTVLFRMNFLREQNSKLGIHVSFAVGLVVYRGLQAFAWVRPWMQRSCNVAAWILERKEREVFQPLDIHSNLLQVPCCCCYCYSNVVFLVTFCIPMTIFRCFLIFFRECGCWRKLPAGSESELQTFVMRGGGGIRPRVLEIGGHLKQAIGDWIIVQVGHTWILHYHQHGTVPVTCSWNGSGLHRHSQTQHNSQILNICTLGDELYHRVFSGTFRKYQKRESSSRFMGSPNGHSDYTQYAKRPLLWLR